MSEPSPVTAIMVAPNGARLTRADHAALPVTNEATIATARSCYEAGAQALHAHVRDADEQHVLDVDRYRHLLALASKELGPHFPVQITTEAIGRYTPDALITLVKALQPRYASVVVREVVPNAAAEQIARDFYHWAAASGVAIQHILFSTDDLMHFQSLKTRDIIPADDNSVLFVLGRYTHDKQADIGDLDTVLPELQRLSLHWMICAFGQPETDCLTAAALRGGGVRIGFENNRLQANGDVAPDNTARVIELCAALDAHNIGLQDAEQLHTLLGGR